MENNSYIFWNRINENCFWAFIGKEVLKWSLMLVTGLLAINKQDGLGTRFVFVMGIIFPPTNRSVVTEHSPLPCSPRKFLEFVGVRVLFWWVFLVRLFVTHENHQCAINNYPVVNDEWSINTFFKYLSLLHFMWTIRSLWHQSLK